MKRILALVATLTMLITGCTGRDAGGGARGTVPGSTASSTPDAQTADQALILTMYDTVNKAFQHSPDDGVRAIIASQYPGDSKDVDFARCVNAISPGAKTLPSKKRMHFLPNISTMTADAGYTVTSDRVKGLRPQGRVYQTDVVITDGGKPTVRSRHQVISSGRAYQFSMC